MTTDKFIYVPTGELWPAVQVDARIKPIFIPGRPKPIPASAWLRRHRPVEQITWAPGRPREIRDMLVDTGGFIAWPGATLYNCYRPPELLSGDPTKAERWLELVRLNCQENADHVVAWMAHRVQHPEVKINHGITLGGAQGCGKDTIFKPLEYAVGPWNCPNISPTNMFDRFQGFLKSVVLRINEARDLGEISRYGLYDHLKPLLAAPPDVLRVEEKYVPAFYIINVVAVAFTTNYSSNGFYLPADDRRHYVVHSDVDPASLGLDYFNELHAWLDAEGNRHIASYLASLDLSKFNPKAPPQKTAAFWDIVTANRTGSGENYVVDALDRLAKKTKNGKWPDVVTGSQLSACAPDEAYTFFRKNGRQVPPLMKAVGYEQIPNPGTKKDDGRWRVGGHRETIYGRRELSEEQRQRKARKFIKEAATPTGNVVAFGKMG